MTDPLPALFASEQAFSQHFDQQLLELVDSDLLGVFILVLGNLGFSAESFARHRQRLQQRFEQLRAHYADPTVEAAPDDLSVFRQLEQHGFDWMQACQFRQCDDWLLQFNRLRSLRPTRNSQANISSLYQAFDADKFQFNKPFLRKEDLWDGELQGVPIRLMYNKFPFAAQHLILLIEPLAQKPQYLGEADLLKLHLLAESLQLTLPKLAFCYNSLGAFASVNHQHFQLMQDEAMPIEQTHWQHNGGDQPYPLEVFTTDDPHAAWQWIAARHEQNQAYHLLFRQSRFYLIARTMQGSISKPDWSEGLGWSEIAGCWSVNQRQTFEQLDSNDLLDIYQQLKP